MKTVYLVVGCPGSGKTFVCERAAEKFHYVPHDDYPESAYGLALLGAASDTKEPGKMVLGEIPFGLSAIQAFLEDRGVKVVPVFIQEDEKVIRGRYELRERREIPKGHLTRQKTYAARARELGAFAGTADQVLEHLKGVK